MGVRNPCKEAFLAGLKAGKDMAETDLATVAYMQGAERYKPKWHYVKDGDLPKDEDWKWCVSHRGYYYVANMKKCLGVGLIKNIQK